MPRPRSQYRIGFLIKITHFKPVGPREADVVVLALEEAEALRLKHIEMLEQIQAARLMGVSQSTFQRLLVSAHEKVTDALIRGKAIRIANQ